MKKHNYLPEIAKTLLGFSSHDKELLEKILGEYDMILQQLISLNRSLPEQSAKAAMLETHAGYIATLQARGKLPHDDQWLAKAIDAVTKMNHSLQVELQTSKTLFNQMRVGKVSEATLLAKIDLLDEKLNELNNLNPSKKATLNQNHQNDSTISHTQQSKPNKRHSR